jgi:hypothetical protein
MPVKWYKDIPDWANQNATTPDGSNVTPYTNMQNRIQMLEEQLRGLNEALHFINYGTNAPSARTSTRVWYGNYENVYTDYEIVGTLTNQITNVATAKKIDIGSTVTSIGDDAFSDCSALTSVTIPDSVTSIPSSAFSGCSELMSFSVASGNLYYKSVSGVLLTKDGKTLICGINGNVTIPDGVTSIGDYAFAGCYGLASVTIPDGVTSIGCGAFDNCCRLTNVTIPNSVTSIGDEAFFMCSTLTSMTIPDTITSIGPGAFYECYDLTDVTIVANGGNANNVKNRIIASIDNEEISDNITWNMPN